jgi:hypothetical protein
MVAKLLKELSPLTEPNVSFSCSKMYAVALGGVMVIVLAIGLKIRGFKPGRWRWIFKGDKNP